MENKKIAARVVKNSFWSFLTSVVNRGGALIFTILLARFLLPEKYGIYSIILSIVMIFYTFTDLGTGQALVRYVSSALATDKGKIFPYHKYLLKLKSILVLTTSFLLILLAYPLSFWVFKNSAIFLPLLVGAVYVFIQSFQSFYGNLFFSAEKVQYYSIRESINQVLKIIFVVFIFYFVSSENQVLGIFLSFILCSSALLLFNLVYTKKVIPDLFIPSESKIEKRKILGFLGFLTLASVASVFFSYMDSIILGIFLAPEYVGYYRVAFSLVLGVWGLVGFPVVVLFPVFTKLTLEQAGRIFNLVFKYISVITVPLVFGLIILGREFIVALPGKAYLPAYFPLIPLSFILFFGSCIDYSTALFTAKEKPQIFAKLIIIVSIFNIVINIILINLFLSISSVWATFGAALGTALSWVLYFVSATVILRKQFAIRVSFKNLIKPLISSLVMSGFLLLFLNFVPMNLISLVLAVLLGMFAYFICMLVIKGFEKKDLKLIHSIIKR